MILVKNDFKGLVEAVFEGRRIFANLRRSFSYLISFHIPVILLALIPPLLGWGDLLLPIHIVLLELIVHPISAFAFENLPSRDGRTGQSLLPLKSLIRSVTAGVVVTLAALWFFYLNSHGSDLTPARSYAMAMVFAGNILFVLIESGFSFSKRILWTVLCLLLFGWLALGFAPLARVLHLQVLSPF
jgi:Ca2+-transporting ATPase